MSIIKEQKLETYRKIVKYKKGASGSTVRELGIDPEDSSRLSQFFETREDKKIEIRIDPLLAGYSLHTTLISEERANRPIVIKPKEERGPDKKNCDFCEPRAHSKTAVPRIIHENQGIISFPNMFPYISPHYVTIFTTEHKTDLGDITESDILNYLQTGKEIANKLKKDGYDGMWDFINWGADAGGSQPHPHSQRGGLYKLMSSLMDRESNALKERRKQLRGRDPFEEYMEFAREDSLHIREDDYSFTFAPFAPRFTDQVDVYTKNDKTISDYTDLDEEHMISISKGMARVLKRLRTERSVTDLNVETHQARFNGDKKNRMHWHIYPRKTSIGSMELNDVYIVSAYPEVTAKSL